VRETALQTQRSVKEGEDVLQALEQRFSPGVRGEDHGEAGCRAAEHGVPQQSRYPPAVQGRPHTGAGGCVCRRLCPHGKPTLEQAPGKTCGSVERGAHAGAGLLAGLVTPWGPVLEQSVPEGLHAVEETMLEHFMKNSPWEGLVVEWFVEDCLPW